LGCKVSWYLSGQEVRAEPGLWGACPRGWRGPSTVIPSPFLEPFARFLARIAQISPKTSGENYQDFTKNLLNIDFRRALVGKEFERNLGFEEHGVADGEV